MGLLDGFERFKDFDETQIKSPSMEAIASAIVKTASGSFIGQYKVQQTLIERLILFNCKCPYCDKALYSLGIIGLLDGNDTKHNVNPDDFSGEFLYSENQPEETRQTTANGLPFRKKRFVVKGSLEYKFNAGVSINIDHLCPRTRGGSDVFHNLLITCDPCNKSKNNLTAEEFGYPEIQRLSKDEPQIPIFTHRGNRNFATIHLPIEVYESFHAIHGDVSQFVHREIEKHNPNKGEPNP